MAVKGSCLPYFYPGPCLIRRRLDRPAARRGTARERPRARGPGLRAAGPEPAAARNALQTPFADSHPFPPISVHPPKFPSMISRLAALPLEAHCGIDAHPCFRQCDGPGTNFNRHEAAPAHDGLHRCRGAPAAPPRRRARLERPGGGAQDALLAGAEAHAEPLVVPAERGRAVRGRRRGWPQSPAATKAYRGATCLSIDGWEHRRACSKDVLLQAVCVYVCVCVGARARLTCHIYRRGSQRWQRGERPSGGCSSKRERERGGRGRLGARERE